VHLCVVLFYGYLRRTTKSSVPQVSVVGSTSTEHESEITLKYEREETRLKGSILRTESNAQPQKQQNDPASGRRLFPNRALVERHTSSGARISSEPESPTTSTTRLAKEDEIGDLGSESVTSANQSEPATLTREQLGLTLNSHLAREEQSSPILRDMKARIATNETLSKSIQQDAVERSGELGLGPEGPILSKLEKLALSNSGIGNGFATLSVRIVDGGKLDFELLGASTDHFQWLKLLEQAKRELQAQKLSPPAGSHGVEFEIRLESRVQLPSGADPGFFVDLFGRTLKKGEGKRSNGVSILSSLPKLKVDESALGQKDRTMAQRLEVDIVKVPLDPADLSGKRSRIISARVVRRTVL
jgi:hypothetical protein